MLTINHSGQAQIEREHAARLLAGAELLEKRLQEYPHQDPQRIRAEACVAEWRTEAAAKLRALSAYLGYRVRTP